MTKILLDLEVVNTILRYLSRQPYGDVVSIIAQIKQNVEEVTNTDNKQEELPLDASN